MRQIAPDPEPHHGPGNDPYVVWEHGTLADAETSFRGVRDEGSQV
jgi:hypothetical protein